MTLDEVLLRSGIENGFVATRVATCMLITDLTALVKRRFVADAAVSAGVSAGAAAVGLRFAESPCRSDPKSCCDCDCPMSEPARRCRHTGLAVGSGVFENGRSSLLDP